MVFDGVAPELKSDEIDARKKAKEKAQKELEEAKEAGDQARVEQLSKRTVRVTKEHNQDIKKLLDLMGLWYVEAPGEAEAQCSRMAADGIVYGVATEDADALTFGAPVICRNLVASEAKQKQYPPCEVVLSIALEKLDLTMEQFIDFCILCGCDYATTIRKIGPSTAYQLIKTHGDIETILEVRHILIYPSPQLTLFFFYLIFVFRTLTVRNIPLTRRHLTL